MSPSRQPRWSADRATMSVAQPARTVVRDVAIIDATGREPEGRHDVLVEDGRIRSIGSPGDLSADVATIDGAGRTLLPGQPLDDVALVADPDNVTLVMRSGVVAKDREGRLA
jgi:N-acyl-D-aspartate/D-glutamate deacylase